MAKLNVKIGKLGLKNPVMTASGTFGYGVEFADFVDLSTVWDFRTRAWIISVSIFIRK